MNPIEFAKRALEGGLCNRQALTDLLKAFRSMPESKTPEGRLVVERIKKDLGLPTLRCCPFLNLFNH